MARRPLVTNLPHPIPHSVRDGAWRSMTPADGRAPPRHEFPTEIGWVREFRFWCRKKWGSSPPPRTD